MATLFTYTMGITAALLLTIISKRPNFNASRTKRKVTPYYLMSVYPTIGQ